MLNALNAICIALTCIRYAHMHVRVGLHLHVHMNTE